MQPCYTVGAGLSQPDVRNADPLSELFLRHPRYLDQMSQVRLEPLGMTHCGLQFRIGLSVGGSVLIRTR